MAYSPGSGAVLQVSISAVFTSIAQQSKFGPIVRKRARVDVTGLADLLEVLRPGIKRFDGIAFEGWFDPADATHQYLDTSYEAGTTELWKIVEADAGAAEGAFSGWLEQLSIGEHVVDGYVSIGGIIVMTTDLVITP